MKLDIILSGVGGQGILSIAAIIGEASLKEGLHIKQAEVHGMSQRGGDVQSNLRISDKEIHSDLIARGSADAIISLEPMEALRYIHYLSSGGWIVTNSEPFVNIGNYPDMEKLTSSLKKLPNIILIDIESLAKDNGLPRAGNMILLGAAAPVLGIGKEKLLAAIGDVFERKGEEVVAANRRAFEIGWAAGEEQMRANQR